MTPELLFYSLALFGGLYVAGTVLCLALYKWDYHRFFHSTLWTKVYYWIPIFICFLVILSIRPWAAITVTGVIVYFIARELMRAPRKGRAAWIYGSAIAAATVHLILFFTTFDNRLAINVLLVVGFSSVLSDVSAYFFGNFLGRHKLPAWINENKSWEGVAGQLIGAVIGFLLIMPVIHPALPILIAIVIGIASATGDIWNSIVKRKIGIKDWGTTIPGHGGVLDRFASLALAIAAVYWCTELIK